MGPRAWAKKSRRSGREKLLMRSQLVLPPGLGQKKVGGVGGVGGGEVVNAITAGSPRAWAKKKLADQAEWAEWERSC